MKNKSFPQSHDRCTCYKTLAFLKTCSCSLVHYPKRPIMSAYPGCIAFLQSTQFSSTWYKAEPTLGNNCILVVEGKEVARCESPPLKRLTEQSSPKCVGGAPEHDRREAGEERTEENGSQMSQSSCASFTSGSRRPSPAAPRPPGGLLFRQQHSSIRSEGLSNTTKAFSCFRCQEQIFQENK